MATTIWEFFGYRADDTSTVATDAIANDMCPILNGTCEKSFNDGTVSGVCTLKPITSEPVICCPIRLYGDEYKILQDVVERAFKEPLLLVPGKEAASFAKTNRKPCVAVFGKKWGGELRLPQKSGSGGYFVDWVLAKLDHAGALEEFVAVEVQTIDTTGNYRNGFTALKAGKGIQKNTAGLNWENVSKRILPQLIYKGQVLQREELCKGGLFFVCPLPVYTRITQRVGGKKGLVRHPLQPAAITFMPYTHNLDIKHPHGQLVPIKLDSSHTTTVYRLQEAFNNVTLPDENVYQAAIQRALGQS